MSFLYVSKFFPNIAAKYRTSETSYIHVTMGRRKQTAYILIVISLLVMVVPVIPHHHHGDSQICMKHDLNDTAGHSHRHDDCGHSCCHNTDCLTVRFFQQVPQHEHSFMPDVPLCSLPPFLLSPLWRSACCPEQERESICHIYIESLHSTRIANAVGLRAPPFV